MRRAQRRQYHYFYKTTCKVTGKYYYGMHSTDNLNDGYMGSGKRLWYSINKYGKENHKLEILEFFDTREKLIQKEINFINEECLKDPMCMNLALGGKGRMYSREACVKGGFKGGRSFSNRLKIDKKFYELISKKNTINALQRKWSEESRQNQRLRNTSKNNPMYGKHQSISSIEKMKFAKSGEKNPSFGTCWIYNIELQECKKIYKTEINLYTNWKLGRKTKF